MKSKIMNLTITTIIALLVCLLGRKIPYIISNESPIWLDRSIGLLVVLLFIYFTTRNIKKSCRLNKIDFKLGLKCIPISMFLILGSLILIECFHYAFPKLITCTQGATDLHNSLESSIAGILVLTIIGPITEELICRGYLLTRFSEIVSVRTAIILQAIFFAMLHGGIIKQLQTLIVGIIYGYFCYYTNSLIPSLIIHIVNNTTIAAISLLPISGNYIVFSIIVLLAIVGIYFLWNIFKEFKNKEKVLQKDLT
ncbi:MAG: lysostaphin resistance A-like protein [Sarcina sp.]